MSVNPKEERAGKLALPLAAFCTGSVDQGRAAEFTLVVRLRGSWWADQASYHPDPEPRL